jgi:hypothetical protein
MKSQPIVSASRAVAAVCIGVSVAAAQVPPAPQYNPPVPQYNPPLPQYNPPLPQYSPPASQYIAPSTGQVTPKNPLLLALIIQPLLQQTGASASTGIGMLFGRLFNALLGRKDPNPNAAAQYPGGAPAYGSAAAAAYAQSVPQYGTAYSPPGGYAQSTPGLAQAGYGTPYGATSASPYGAATPYSPTTSNPVNPGYPATSPTPYSTQYPTTYPSPAPGTPGASNPVSGYPPAPGGAVATGAYAAASPYPTASGTPAYPYWTSPGTPPIPASKAAVVPSVVYSLERLDPKTYKMTSAIDLGHGAPTLHTGDVFAIEYSTNVPGQVRIDNVDSAGQKAALGTYTVLSGHDNRIPVTKGIKLIGSTGTETFKLYFFPCLPADAGGNSDAAAASAGLPSCPAGPSPQLLKASNGLVGAKAAVNLDSPDPTIAVSAVASYQPNDVTESDFQIRHLPLDPGSANQSQ